MPDPIRRDRATDAATRPEPLPQAGLAVWRAIAEGRRLPEPRIEQDCDLRPALRDALRHRSVSGKPVLRLS